MTVIEGNIQDIGMAPLSGVLVATSVDFRASGDVVIAPESRSFPVEAGLVSADLVPGPTRLTVQVGSHARGEFDVVVPDEGPVSLASLVEEAFPWEPEQVAEFARLRDEAVAAADRAEAAAGDVDSAIAGAADQVVAAVEADRVAAEQAASDAAGSASSAAGSASAAAGSASDAASSATASGSSATAAAGSAGDAAGSASAAASSASDAAGSATGADAARAAAVVARTGAEAARSGAESARDVADGHATRAETAANEFDLTATATTGAPGSNATVAVTGDGPAYALGFTVPRGDKGETGDTGPKGDQGDQGIQGPKGDKGDTGPKGDRGDDGEVSQAMLDAAVASLVDNAPEALDTLTELAAALGNDPNFATTVSTEIGKRALQTDVDTALSGKADTSHSHPVADVTGLQAELDGKVADGDPRLSDARTPTAHTHTVSDLTATGTASSTTYLRGDGSWATPPNTTYSVPTQAEAEAGTATTGRAFSAQRVRQAIDARAVTRQGAATGLWIGTEATLPATGTAGVLYVTTD